MVGPALWGEPAARWSDERDDTLVCVAVRDETHDVRTFHFRPAAPALFRFRPGQFLTFDFEIGGETINRCYTISSPPTRPDTISITVKRHPGGQVSNWLHDTMRPGMNVKALGPSGEFCHTLKPAEKYLFLSGGSGITPLMSMARTHYDLGADADIVFVHSARTPADIIFRDELGIMARALPGFKPLFVVDKPDEAGAWTGPMGFLTLQTLRGLTRDFAQREIYCCGPAPYMANVRQILDGIGFDRAHYHEESFSFDAAPAEAAAAAPLAASDAAVESYKIEFSKLGRTIECRADQFILDAAKETGLRLPFACTKGVCGTCKTKKLSGEIEMKHGGGIRQREIDQGMVLVCCGKPKSDVVLER
ncbi:MAG: hybrid-cluster NAD(P)-dependent oxidoreductase [Hyphomicrobium sp.]|nr:hybrid-cluster NAD(P)-dependent oxidoreductase [Hyphomicrobium sp.]